ncbi:MAG: hypothetical protein RIC55_19815 [Pirellulaceae bacterium]
MEASPATSTSSSVVCERKSLLAILFSGFGLLVLLLAPLTLGISLIALIASYYAFPRRVWLEGDRIRASKRLPADGITMSDVREVDLYLQRFLFFPLNRYVMVKYERHGQTGTLGLNRLYYGAAGFDAAVNLFAEASRSAAPEQARPQSFKLVGVFRYLATFVAVLAVVAGIAMACVLQFTRISEEEAARSSLVDRIELREKGENTYHGEPIAAMDMLDTWLKSTEQRLSGLRTLQMISAAVAGGGMLVLLGVWFTGPKASPSPA